MTAANCTYYLYILGEFLVVFFSYFIRQYQLLQATFTVLMASFLLYFW